MDYKLLAKCSQFHFPIDMNAVRTLASKVAPVAGRRALSTAATPSGASFKEIWAVGEVSDHCTWSCLSLSQNHRNMSAKSLKLFTHH